MAYSLFANNEFVRSKTVSIVDPSVKKSLSLYKRYVLYIDEFINSELLDLLHNDTDRNDYIHYVLIEQQMSRNKTMSIIESILITMLYTHIQPFDRIRLINPRLKLAFLGNQSHMSYSQKKRFAKNYCIDTLNIQVNTPDEADTVLQAIGFMRKEGIDYDLPDP